MDNVLFLVKTFFGGLLFSASYAPLCSPVTTPLEREYATYRPGGVPVDYIAVLGSGYVSDMNLPVSSEVDPTGVVRLVEGIRIYRLNPGSQLIFTGYDAGDPESYPEKMKELALELGIPEGDVLAFTGPKDTEEEARLIVSRFADTKLVLVTSAAHMPRAMGLFRKAGLEPIPAPTNHLGRPVLSKWVFPDADTLYRSKAWLHEQIGLIWARLMGHIKE
jgi:uncharacterized SAM-binding protein YcdF (DUF218 family)